MTALLDIRGLQVCYSQFAAVRDLSIAMESGETLALVGESGCGKSTSALAMMGLLPGGAQVSGKVLLQGKDILTMPVAQLRRLRGKDISMVFQDSMTSLNPVLTVGAQIVEALRLHEDISVAEARKRAVKLLELVEIPKAAERVGNYPHQFSGGQRQRVAIAMAIACRPKLLIADEPTTALDVTVQRRILELLDRLKRELSMGLLLITHDLGLVGQWADRVAIMLQGAKVEEGAPGSIFAAPRDPYTRVLLGAALNLDSARHYRTTRLAELGRPVAELPAAAVRPPAAEVANGGPLLSVEGIHAHYASRGGAVAAVNGVTFDIQRGETVGLVGESGCGKSTLSRTILRLLPSSGGRILFEGTDITRLGDAQLKPFRPRMQMIFQDPYASLNPRHRIGEIMQATLKTNGVRDAKERRARIAELIDRVRLTADTLDRFPHEISGGQRQRVGIARALLLRPSLLICDEPASSLDLPIQAQVLNLLAELKAEFNLSYLFISHDLSVVRYMADRVIVMQAGRIVEQGGHGEIWEHATHAYTRKLIAAMPRMAADQRHSPPPTALFRRSSDVSEAVAGRV